MFFAFASLIVAISCSIITGRTLLGYANIRWSIRIMLFLLLLTAWCSPFILNVLHNQAFLSNSTYGILYSIGYILFGYAFILFIAIFIRDGLWFSSYYMFGKSDAWNPSNPRILTKVNIITVVMTIAIAFYGWLEATKVPAVKRIELTTPKINQQMTILQINDLHLHRSKSIKHLRAIVNLANSLKPDIIVMPGDIIDDTIGHLSEQLGLLTKLNAPRGIFVSIGKHEYYHGVIPIMWQLQQMGFTLLSEYGTKINGTDVYIAGVPDNPLSRKFVHHPDILTGSDEEDYRILLTHNPTYAKKYIRLGFDLLLAAHTHGGQIFPFHIFTKLANKFLAGQYDIEDGVLYISRGAGYWGPPMRILAPSDITLITLKPEKPNR